MGRYTWLLDPVHGGIIDGEYQTLGKRSPVFPDGSILYEGEFNRDIVSRILQLSTPSSNLDLALGSVYTEDSGLDPRYSLYATGQDQNVINLVNTQEDLPLSHRVRKANLIHKERKNCIYVSIHANAFGDGKTFNSANGISVFHHVKSSKGKILANTLQKQLVNLTGLRNRGVKANESWANFYILRKTNMPAILSENGFMTNLKEASLLNSADMRMKIAQAHLNMILEIEKNGL